MKLLLCAALAAGALCAQTFSASPLLDKAVEQAVAEGQIPGAVLLIGHNGQIVHRKAYGKRALLPVPEPMTVDTIFDLASLTKVVATTSSLMKLFEEGKFRINDRITQYMPEFEGGKSELYALVTDPAERVNQFENPQFVTIRNSLTAELNAWKQRYSR